METEIRTFYSLKELREAVEEQIELYKNLIEDYSQWLGSFLRDYEETYGDQEWFKNLTALQKTLKKEKKPKKAEKKGKKKKGASSPTWIPFKELMLCTTEQGEAEILFEAIEEISSKVERLERIKTVTEDLERVGLGKEILYLTYIRNGIPEKIVLKPRKTAEFAEKFKYIANFSITKSF